MQRFKNIGLFGAIVAFTIGFMLLMAPACRTPKIQYVEKVVVKDSLVDRIVDRIVYQPHTVPGDTVKVVIKVPCDQATNKPKNGTYTVNGSRSNIKVDVVDGVITATGICNELRDSIAVKNTLIEKLSKSQNNQSQVKIITETKIEKVYVETVPKWAWWCLGISILWVLLFITKIVLKLTKTAIPKPFKTILQWLS